jgi:hypothetical protein
VNSSPEETAHHEEACSFAYGGLIVDATRMGTRPAGLRLTATLTATRAEDYGLWRTARR